MLDRSRRAIFASRGFRPNTFPMSCLLDAIVRVHMPRGRLETSGTTWIAAAYAATCTIARSSRLTTRRACATSSPEKAPKIRGPGWCRVWHSNKCKQCCREQAPAIRFCVRVLVLCLCGPSHGRVASSLLCREAIKVIESTFCGSSCPLAHTVGGSAK